MLKAFVFALTVQISLLGMGQQTFTEGPKKPKGQSQHSHQQKAKGFSDADRRVLRKYVNSCAPGALPPGLAKRGHDLPPGLEKQLVRNGVLPPGLQKRIQPVPYECERLLPPLVPPYRRGFIEGRVILYDETSFLLVDVFLPF
jgi:hypothetical protein